MLRAAEAGSALRVIGRPITRMSAPSSSAARGVAIRFWSWVSASAGRMPANVSDAARARVTAGDPAAVRNDIESVLRRYHVKFELRSLGQKELVYDTELPLHTRTDRIANAILSLGKNGDTEVAWDEKKSKK